MNDIDLGGPSTPWTPIGTSASPFTGTLDGGGHVISNMYCYANNPSLALIGAATGCNIQNIGLYNVSITNTNGNNAGGAALIGTVVGSSAITVSNCYATGVINAGT